ncbi:MAG: hypothetical protein K2M46_14420 [Lachnospiraceae bacterium]|nr:hypothetical protein [Lachnospiraceae bacterium]
MNQQINPFQMMMQAKNPQGLAQMLKGNEKIMSSEMGKNFVGMLEKGDMNGISELGQNVSQSIGFTPDNLKEKVPEPMRRMLGM